MVRHAPELSGYRHEHGYRWSCKKLRSTPTRRRTVTNLESVHVKSIACFQSWTSVIACFMYMNTLQDIWEGCILWYLQWRILQIFKLRDQCHLIAVFGVLVLLIWNSVGIPAGIHPIPKQPWSSDHPLILMARAAHNTLALYGNPCCLPSQGIGSWGNDFH